MTDRTKIRLAAFIVAFILVWMIDFGIGYFTCMVLGPGIMTAEVWRFLWVSNLVHTVLIGLVFIMMFAITHFHAEKKA